MPATKTPICFKPLRQILHESCCTLGCDTANLGPREHSIFCS